MKLRRRSGIWLVSVVTVCVATALGAALLRRNARQGLPPHSEPSSLAAPFEPDPKVEDPNVLVHITSTPAGAAIVSPSHRAVLGYTPETVQFRRSPEVVQIRLELKGYLPETRDVSTATDGKLDVVLRTSSLDSRPQL
jgi:hypothetical protein